MAKIQRFSEVLPSDEARPLAGVPGEVSMQPLYPNSGAYLRYYVFRPYPGSYSDILQEETEISFSPQMCYFIINSPEELNAEEYRFPVGYIGSFTIISEYQYTFSCAIPDGSGNANEFTKTTENSMDCIIAIWCDENDHPWNYIYAGLGSDEEEKRVNFTNWFKDITELGYDEGYWNGNGAGWSEGFNQGRDQGWQDGYNQGYEIGRNDGISQGGDANIEITQQGLFYGVVTFTRMFFSLATSFLSTPLVGDLTLGLFVIGIPCTFMLINLAIGLAKKWLGGRGASEGDDK